MIDFIIRQLFKWESLRLAIFSEVDWHNSIVRTMNDPDAMKIAMAMWCESDGWRGWNYNETENKYYFHDLPESGIYDIMDILQQQEEK